MIIIFSNNNEKKLFLRKTNFCLLLEKKMNFISIIYLMLKI